MATRQLNDTSASLAYTPSGGAETTHLLALPLGCMRAFVPSRVISVYDWWPEDNIDRRTVSIGTGVEEVIFTDRFNDEPVEMMDLLQDAQLNNTTITYIPVLSGNEYPFKVVEIMGAPIGHTTIEQDAQRWGAGEWQVSFRARRVDGGSFATLIATNT